MQFTFYILLSFAGLLIFIEDLRTGLVTVWKILVILLLSMAITFFSSNNLIDILKNVSINLAIIVIIYLSLVLFYFLKEREFNFLLKNKAGLADGLLFIAPAICFSNVLFLYFLLLSIVGALMYAICLRVISRFRERKITIPLAGITSLLFCVALIMLDILKIDRFDDAALFEKFILP